MTTPDMAPGALWGGRAPTAPLPTGVLTPRPSGALPGASGSLPSALPQPQPPAALTGSRLPTGGATTRGGQFTPEAARQDIPILQRPVNGRPVIWLDNGATTQKPRQVIETLASYYATANSNIHRGAHTLAREATDLYEGGRAAAADFLGAPSPDTVVLTRGTTEAVNLVAQTWGRANLGPGDEILVSALEHHSNIVPWQMIAKERRARVVPVPLLSDGSVDQEAYASLLSHRTRLVAISHASNVLGTVPPVREMTALAHRYGARVLVDGAQAVAHFPVDVQRLDADFYAFSAHKLYGPTGVGALYGKPEVLAAMPPWQGGGNMIDTVDFDHVTFAPVPHCFEAGTGHIAGVVGLKPAIDWLTSFDRDAVAAYESALLHYAEQALATVPGLEVLGTTPDKIAVMTFTLAGHAPMDIARWLDQAGIAIRAGHHCAQPSLRHYGLESAARASLALYNTAEEVDELVAALHQLQAQGGGHGG